MSDILPADESALALAARLLAAGGVVVFPTDTVYGLCCDLGNPEAVRRIYAIKGRPAAMPLIAMLPAAEDWPRVAAAASAVALAYMARWWPGPLTIILPARVDLPPEVLGGGQTIGVRVPDHPVALRLLQLAGCPLATTSANRSGQPSTCAAADAAAQVGDDVDLVLDAGPCPGGVPSTLVDCSTDPPRVLREGPVTI